MRFAWIKRLISENWLISLEVFLGAIITFIGFASSRFSIPLWGIGLLLILISVITFFEKKNQQEEGLRLRNTLNNLENNQKGESARIKKMQKNLKEQKEHVLNLKKEKRASLSLLGNLIKNGIISQEEVLGHLPSTDIYSLYCFPTSLKQFSYNGKPIQFNRLYPKFLEDLGFVRTTMRGTDYITTSKRLKKKFRNTRYLRDHILFEIEKILPKEWDEYLNLLKKYDEGSIKEFCGEVKKDSYENHLKFSIILIRGKLDENNVHCLRNERTYRNDIDELLKEEINFKEIELSSDKKIKIKEFLLDSSLEIFFYGVGLKDLNKIISLESKLKENLKIVNFLDYLKCGEKDIANILLDKFPEQDSIRYAKRLTKSIKNYESALADLGIAI